jgi:hypothetical protein
MPPSRARVALVSLTATLSVGLAVHGQQPLATGFTLIENLGLPAVETGALVGEPRSSNISAGQSRGALGAAMAADPGGRVVGLSCVRGR